MISVALGCAAITDDLRRRQIANWINLSGLAAGLICHFVSGGLAGLGRSAGGAALGFALFLIFYCLGGMGAGDLKLSAAFGALLGPSGILVAALLAAPIGALVAGVLLIWRGARAIPYAPALTLGAWLALLGRG
ncbi:MAG TPA: prepilin peptidase [Bryobacteraceae bacterium]|nr:prepilin peptidase [Bryobacteraceae bacterium]